MAGTLRLKGATSGYVEFTAPDSGANTTVNAGLLVYKDSENGTITGTSTNDISEGSNLYYTTARFDSDFATKDLHDSVAVQAQIDATIASTDTHDSVAVQAQFDSAFPSAFDTRFALQDTHDSVAVQGQIDSAAVLLTSTQTIAGDKTFTNTVKSNVSFRAGSSYQFTKSTTSGTDNALYYDSDNLYVGRDAKDLRFRTNFATVGMGIDSAGAIYTGATGLGDKLSLYDNRLNGTNMYGFGIGGSTIYYKSLLNHDFYVAENYDGTSHKVRIDGDGIKFHGDTAAANALDDYEEGTWTPAYAATSGAFGTVTYAEQSGRYVKIGRLVMVTFDIRTSEFNVGTATGSVQLTGLPFQVNGTESTGTVGAQSSWVTYCPEYFMPQSGSTAAWLRYTNGASYASIEASNMQTGVGTYNRLLGGSGVYYTNS